MSTDALPPLTRPATIVALVTAMILAVPLVAMQFTDEVQWSAGDFLAMGSLLSGSGMLFVLLTRGRMGLYRLAMGVGVLSGLFLIWVNLAVGIVMEPPHPANLLYFVALAAGAIVAAAGHFTPRAMSRALLATVAGIAVNATIVLLGDFDPPGIKGDADAVLLLNGFFALPFAASAALFHVAARGAAKT